MNQARAVLWAQFLTWRNYAKRAGVSWMIVVSVLWYGMWLFFSGIAFLTMADPEVDDLADALPAAFLIMFLYWQFIPLMTASSGASLDMRRLLAYPIPTNQLFGIELMLRSTAAIEMLMVLAGASLGVLFNPTLPAWAALSALPFIAFNLLLALGVRDIVVRLMARRRIRELVAVAFLAIWLIPSLLFRGPGEPRRPRGQGPPEAPSWMRSLFESNSWDGFPWTATANLLNGTKLALSVAVLAGWCALAAVFALWQFRRTLMFDAQAASARGTRANEKPGRGEWFFRLPSLLRDPIGALVEKELRYLFRAPAFRILLLMGCGFGLFITRTLMRADPDSWAPGYLAVAGLYALLLMGEMCFFNTFGFDRAASQIYFLAPTTFRQALIAKNVTAGIFIALEVIAITVICVALRMPITPFRLAEAIVVPGVMAVYLMSLGNFVSVSSPRPVNPAASMRTSSSGKKQGMILILYPLAMIPPGLAYLAAWALESRAAFFAVMGVVAAIAAVIYKVALDSAAERAYDRREAMVTTLAATEGPITT